MTSQQQALRSGNRGRGRPARLSPERIGKFGAQLGLGNVTVAAIAAELGVSEMSIYRHVHGATGLRRAVANYICSQFAPEEVAGEPLADALMEYAAQVRQFVLAYPGIGDHMLNLGPDASPTLKYIDKHQQAFAARYGFSLGQASVLLAAITSYVTLLTEYEATKSTPEAIDTARDFPGIHAGIQLARELGEPWHWSTRALIDGLLAQPELRPGRSESDHSRQ